jgi:hypothetical protein
LPRGLGDDPLKRKRSSSTRAKSVPSAQRDESVIQQTSHNDVFFRRRSEDNQAAQVGPPQQVAVETPEIAEVNDIVRVAEAAQAARPTFIESRRLTVNEPVVIVEAPSPMTERPATSQTEDSSEAKPEPGRSGGFFRRLFGRHGK